MKRLTSILLIAVLLGLGYNTQAQDKRTLETKVADILAQMPTHDLPHRDRLMNEMIGLGEEGLTQFTKMVVAPGTGDDTNVRFALGSLAHHVGQPGYEEGRLLLSKVFQRALESKVDKEVKAFFLYHADFFAGDEMVKTVAQFVTDSRLSEPAISTLISIGSHKVGHVLMSALGSAEGANLARLIYGIGELAEPHAVDALVKFEGSADPAIQHAMISAYSKIGAPQSYKFMMAAAKKSGFAYDHSRAMPGLMNYADALARNGHLEAFEKICKTVIKKCSTPANITYKLTALRLQVEHLGYGAIDVLLDELSSTDKKVRGAVLANAQMITDVAATRAFMDAYPKQSPVAQVELINFFGKRGDLVALPLVEEALFGGHTEIKQAAMIAIADLIGTESLPYLLDRMAKGSDSEVASAKAVLSTLVGPFQIDALAASFENQGKAGKIAVLDLLAARKAKKYFDLFLKNTKNEDVAIQQAAYNGLDQVADLSDMKALIGLIYKVNEGKYLSETQAAIIAAAKQAKENQAKPVLDAYSGATKKQAYFLGVLPALGGDAALKTVAKAFKEGDAELREVAFNALTQWKDYSASTALFTICEEGNKEYQGKAFAGYVRQIKGAPVTADQKLLLLRKIMPLAKNQEQKLSVIQALNGNHTFLTLVYLGKLMDDAALANAAGRAAASVALPPSGSKEGMYGKVAEEILRKAINSISGEEADYVKANIQRWLEAMPKDDGYVSMFNGKDLSGWQGLVKNPIARAKMSEKELAKAQAVADARLPEMWTVANEEIRFTGTGYENLCSIKEYGDFEMLVDWRITKKGDSGIYLRGTPQVQIWDTSRVEVGAQVGSGGLYNNQKHESKPTLVADNPINDWNTFYIKMVGENVTVYLNGKLVVDNVTLENYWDRSIPIFPTGPIELQAHGTDLAFRDIFVREIKSGEYGLTVEEKTGGFVSLFNGKNLDGWIGNKTDYIVEDGVIVIRPKRGGHGNLYTEKEYADFNYRFEFQLTPGANNGLGIRTPPSGDAAYLGMELQILDNTAPIYANLQPYQYHGSVYGVIAAKRGFLKPVGEWNQQEVIVQGTRIKIILNGTVIVDGDIADARDNGTLDHKDHPGLKNTQGHIGFLGHGSVVKFRNIRIKEL